MKKESMGSSDYTMRRGKESVIANKRQAMGEAQHESADSFVKSKQRALLSKGGQAPNLKAESMEFNAYMCNNGMHAQDFARTLTSGLDKEAFPVK